MKVLRTDRLSLFTILIKYRTTSIGNGEEESGSSAPEQTEDGVGGHHTPTSSTNIYNLLLLLVNGTHLLGS